MIRMILVVLLVSMFPTFGLAEQPVVRIQREKSTPVVVHNPTPPPVQHYEEIVGNILRFQFQEGQASAQRQAAVWLSVRTQSREPIENLQVGDFTIAETINGVRRSIPADKVTLEHRPLATVLLQDVSGSMRGEDLEYCRQAIGHYIDQMRPGDRAELVFFGSQSVVAKSFTNSKLLLQAALYLSAIPGGGTSLFDAIALGLGELQQVDEHHLKVLVVLTDGIDTESHRSLEDVVLIAAESAIPIFTVGVGEVDAPILQRLSEVSHGLYFPASTTAELTSLYDAISRTLRSAYVLSYSSMAEPGDTVRAEITVGKANQGKVIKFYGQQVAP